MLSILYSHPSTLGNILSYPILFPIIFFLSPEYSQQYSVLVQYILFSPKYTREYSVLPHIIPNNIFPQPRVFTAIFCLSSVYSMFTQITPWNILSYPIFFLQILFLSPDYRREYSDSAHYIQSTPKIY